MSRQSRDPLETSNSLVTWPSAPGTRHNSASARQSESPPNFSSASLATVSATIASAATPAAGTTHTSLRSYAALVSSRVANAPTPAAAAVWRSASDTRAPRHPRHSRCRLRAPGIVLFAREARVVAVLHFLRRSRSRHAPPTPATPPPSPRARSPPPSPPAASSPTAPEAHPAAHPSSRRCPARRRAVHHHLKHAAYRIAGPQHRIHLGLHPRLGLSVHAVQQYFVFAAKRRNLLPCSPSAPARRGPRGSRGSPPRCPVPAALLGYARRAPPAPRFPRPRSLQHVPRIGKIVLQRARQVRMPGSRRGHRLVFCRIARTHRQHFGPVLPVSVLDASSQSASRSSSHAARRSGSAPCPSRCASAHRVHSPAADATARDSRALHRWERPRACPRAEPQGSPHAIHRLWKNAA